MDKQLSPRTVEAILNCLDAMAADEREPERYRTWYAEAAAEVRAKQVAPSVTTDAELRQAEWASRTAVDRVLAIGTNGDALEYFDIELRVRPLIIDPASKGEGTNPQRTVRKTIVDPDWPVVVVTGRAGLLQEGDYSFDRSTKLTWSSQDGTWFAIRTEQP